MLDSSAPAHPFRLVILDFDGTLADSGPWFAGVLNAVARRYRFREVTREELERIRSESPATMLRTLGVARWKLPFIARHMRGLMRRDIAAIALFPGIDRLLQLLHHAGVATAVVSSNAEGNVRRVLGPELAALITHWRCGSSLFGKARVMRRLVGELRSPVGAVLAVGDEIRDIDAAESVGAAAAAVTWGYAGAAALRARKPRFVVDTVGELIALLVPAAGPPEMAAPHLRGEAGGPPAGGARAGRLDPSEAAPSGLRKPA